MGEKMNPNNQEQTGIYKYVDGKIAEVQIPLDEAIRIYKEDPKSLYPDHFFAKMQRIRGWQNEFAEKLAKELKLTSVVDFGCGNGYYLEGFKKENCYVLGFEYGYDYAKQYVPEIIKDFVCFGDVMQPINLSSKKDLAMSIEVAEHILPEKSQTFVDNLANASNQYILFSAATPDQTGTGHINARLIDFWLDLFREKGFNLSKDLTGLARGTFKNLTKRSPYTRLLSNTVNILIN